MQKNHAITRLWHAQSVRRARHFASPRRWYRYLTANRRPLPRFVIAGAQKAGTTSLYGYLAGHPQCLRPLAKEVNFFDQNYARGQRWYRMHFPIARTDELGRSLPAGASCIEASPHYMFEPEVAARARILLPDLKAIFLLRNPVARAYSHYHHEVRRGRETRTFEESIALEIQQQSGAGRASSTATKQHGGSMPRRTYLARGVYVDQLRNWRAHFPAEQTLAIEAERMFTHPREVFDEVLAFLELDPWTPTEFGNLNPGRYHAPISPVARDRATRYFAPHNERLFHFLEKRFEWC